MVATETVSEMRRTLLDRRRELIDLRRSLTASWQALNQPEKEAAETASKENISREKEQRSESLQTEIQQIDNALTKMDEGRYGRCEACGKRIQPARLRALPATRYCVQCSGAREAFRGGGITDQPVAAGTGRLTDEEMLEAILDALETDGRVETEELDITCEDGVVYLDGVVPSQSSREILMEIINDVLDFDEVVDNLALDRQPWERRERRPDSGKRRPSVEERLGEDEQAVDLDESLQTGEPMTPPDALIPERE